MKILNVRQCITEYVYEFYIDIIPSALVFNMNTNQVGKALVKSDEDYMIPYLKYSTFEYYDNNNKLCFCVPLSDYYKSKKTDILIDSTLVKKFIVDLLL